MIYHHNYVSISFNRRSEVACSSWRSNWGSSPAAGKASTESAVKIQVQLQLEKSRNVLQPAATSKRHEEFHARSVTWKYLEGDPSGNNTVSTVSILCQYCVNTVMEVMQNRDSADLRLWSAHFLDMLGSTCWRQESSAEAICASALSWCFHNTHF